MYLKQKISQNLLIGIFAILILFDLVGVDRRYVNTDNFVSALKVNKPYQANSADMQIMQDPGHFRVLDVSEASRMPARAAYFHNSLSGYHAAKLKRFDALYDFHIAKNNVNVLNMLNTKYIIVEDESGNIVPSQNYTNPNGNAWFVSEIEKLKSADAEILALDSLKTRQKAITTSPKLQTKHYNMDSSATISVSDYKPNYLKYVSSSANDSFAVFSEIYYGQGWNAYIDGIETPHYRVDYVLRGMPIPKGSHVIEFKFEPEVVKTGSTIALASSVLFGLLVLGGVVFLVSEKKKV